MKQTNSLELYERAKKVIPGGAQVLSKYYGRLIQGVAPAFMEFGQGAHIWDVDGNEYIDWSASLGPVILGYNTIKPFSEHYSNPLLPMSHWYEIELAEKLIDIIPCAEMVRFFKTGSDSTSAAVRLARAITGRSNVLCCGFHGWHDWYAQILPDPKNSGTGQDPNYFRNRTIKLSYGWIEQLQNCLVNYQPACFILEPMSRLCPEKASREYLQEVRRLCNEYGVILIFDEIIMGFRYAMAGGQEYYGVTPDLACYSKAMANGYPISALVGKRELMTEIQHLQVSGTYFGELLSIQSAINTIDFMEKNDVIKHIAKVGEDLCTAIEKAIVECGVENMVRLKGGGPWSSFVWGEDFFDEQCLFLQELFKQGIFYNRDFFVMFSHTYEDLVKTIDAIRFAFNVVKRAMDNGLKINTLIEGTVDKELMPR